MHCRQHRRTRTIRSEWAIFLIGLAPIAVETGDVLVGVKPDREQVGPLILSSDIDMDVCDVAVSRAIDHQALVAEAGTPLSL